MFSHNFRFYLLCFILPIGPIVFGQESTIAKKLSLEEAISLALQKNKSLQASTIKNQIAAVEVKDLKNERLPEVGFKGSFGVLDNLRQYEQGLFKPSTPYETPRLKYGLDLEASVPIYTGGKLKYDDEKAEVREEMSLLKYKQLEKDVKIQVIDIYLKSAHFEEEIKLMQDKMHEDSVVIELTEKLKANGLVTYNDVLRAKLQLSNHKMNLSELINETNILTHKLKTALALEEDEVIALNTSNLIKTIPIEADMNSLMQTAYQQNEVIALADKNIELKELDKKLVRSNVLPKVSGVAEYGYNYPNFMFFPPVSHIYRFGMVGVAFKMPISTFYTNKVKMNKANKEIALSKVAKAETHEQLNHEVYAAQQRLVEAERKIVIAKEAIEQAKENYRIVKVKYNNQLSLITELVDADNAYLSAQSNLIALEINKQLKYYQLAYILGNI